MEGFFKLNFDGAVNTETMKAGVGDRIRNHKGENIAAYLGAVKVTNPLEAYLQYLMYGVKICSSDGLSKIIIEKVVTT